MPGVPSAVEVLVRFARVVSEEQEPTRALRVLVDAAIQDLGADAAGVFCVTPEGPLRLCAARNLPAEVQARALSCDAIGPELGSAVQAACAGRFTTVPVLPLVSGGDLFGALVLGFGAGAPLAPGQMELARGLVDLAAVALRSAQQFEELRRTNADLLRARQALDRAEKLSALGEMAAGIAHDLANVLTPLVADVENLKAAPPTPERLLKTTTRMGRCLRVGTDLLERLRRFARQAPERGHVSLDPSTAVRDAAEMCQARGRLRGVQVSHELGPLPQVVVDPSDLTSALVNLIVNGIDAQPEGGSVTVSAGTDARGRAWVEVADRGPGFSEAARARLFQPFFTTKGERGTGLGLASVYAFVQRHGGTIDLLTAEGQGATFRLEFPAATAVTTAQRS